jgi:hypothetical protein
MLIYGVRERSILLAELGQRSCAHCGDWREFTAQLHYTFMHVYWVFGAVLHREYLAVCDRCDRGVVVERDQIAHMIDQDPIPLVHRWGFGIVLPATLAAIAAVIVSHRNDF